MNTGMNTTSAGNRAEDKACQFLSSKGYKVLQRNWRTKLCEIDIIATKDKEVFFVEVKYRNQSAQGRGLDYITTKKQKQMKFAAQLWVHEFKWLEDYSLAAIEISGEELNVTAFEEVIL